MHLKILPFRNILIKKDFKIISWICLFIVFSIFMTMTLGIIREYRNYKYMVNYFEEASKEYNKEDLIKQSRGSVTGYLKHMGRGSSLAQMIIIPLVLSILLFSEEKRNRTFEALSSMPFTKYEIFFNKLVLCFITIVIANLINIIFLFIVKGINKELGMLYSMKDIIFWSIRYVYIVLAFLSFFTLLSTITGTTASFVVISIIFLVFPISFPLLLKLNLGIWGVNSSILMEIEKIGFRYNMFSIFDVNRLTLSIFIPLTIVFFIISIILFYKNKTERSGETLEFEKLEEFFTVGVTICTSLLFGLLSSDFSIGFGIDKFYLAIGYIVGGVLGYLAAYFSIKLNRVKG
ncbi:ABC-2 transporter permease [Tissierella sp. MSJ-40]|uniref:ABC-2 transporter permease n=1 Tax=Tissierella simiarum TaxID=2841534 RepID=A0ABS6E6E4_9FIRM|nr:ABC-2 transporter permease [Tissierella simiarum]MBU5437799.1 ABC-2 transporter permease [Tissierella simiarum]